METLRDSLRRIRREWEDRFEARFGFWRGLADEAARALPRLRDPRDETMRIVAIISERSVITKVLTHLGKPAAVQLTEGAGPGPPRHPPPGPAPAPSVN